MNTANGGIIWNPPGPDMQLGVQLIDYDNPTSISDRLVVGGVALNLNVLGSERFTIKFGTPASTPDVAMGLASDIEDVFETFAPSGPGFFALDAIVGNTGTLLSGSFHLFGILNDAGGLSTSNETQLLLEGSLVGMDTSSFPTEETIKFTATTEKGYLENFFPSTFDVTFEGFPKETFFENSFKVEPAKFGSVASTVPEPMSAVIWSSALILGGVLSRRRRTATTSNAIRCSE
ncbi:hypothetical protein [Novipirellula maiorica]|nr:hypothetical protein [Rhodopirellula maiorica]